MREEKKFVEEGVYPGAPTEEIRSRCEARVNRFLDEVQAILSGSGKKEDAVRRARVLEDSFAGEDTEEREKVGDYIGEVMRLLRI